MGSYYFLESDWSLLLPKWILVMSKADSFCANSSFGLGMLRGMKIQIFNNSYDFIKK